MLDRDALGKALREAQLEAHVSLRPEALAGYKPYELLTDEEREYFRRQAEMFLARIAWDLDLDTIAQAVWLTDLMNSSHVPSRPWEQQSLTTKENARKIAFAVLEALGLAAD